MKLEDHCVASIRLFGDEYREIHLWLDECFSTLGARHRRKRHHLAGIEIVRHKWGDKAAAVARQHIIDDLRQEGWTEKDGLQRDEDHYTGMGLF